MRQASTASSRPTPLERPCRGDLPAPATPSGLSSASSSAGAIGRGRSSFPSSAIALQKSKHMMSRVRTARSATAAKASRYGYTGLPPGARSATSAQNTAVTAAPRARGGATHRERGRGGARVGNGILIENDSKAFQFGTSQAPEGPALSPRLATGPFRTCSERTSGPNPDRGGCRGGAPAARRSSPLHSSTRGAAAQGPALQPRPRQRFAVARVSPVPGDAFIYCVTFARARRTRPRWRRTRPFCRMIRLFVPCLVAACLLVPRCAVAQRDDGNFGDESDFYGYYGPDG